MESDWQELTARELYSFAQAPLEQVEGKMYVLEHWPAVLQVDSYDRAWVVGNLPYQIEVFPPSGERQFRIRREFDLKDYDQAYREDFESHWEGYASVPMIWPRLPEKQPAIHDISRGPEGEMWVFTKAWVDSPMVQVDVFTEDGIYVRAFLADVALAGYPFASDHVYRADRAEDGSPLLVRSVYRLPE